MHYEKFADGSMKCIEDAIQFELPKGWRWVRLGTVYEHSTGKALNSSNAEGVMLTYITTSNLYWDRFELDSIKEMPFTDAEIDKYTVKKGDLLVCEGGDIGRSAIWNYDDEIRIQNHIHRLRSYVSLSNRFYYYVLYLWKKQERIGGQGIGLQSLSSKALHKILVPLPPTNEQQNIVDKLDYIFNFISDLDIQKDDFLSLVDLTKSKILDLGIQGKLVPQNPEDEPASMLLERIRSEKEELIRQGKIKRDKKESVIFKGGDNSYYEKISGIVENINDKIPFRLPENWKFIRFKELWELISGRDLSPSKYNADCVGIPYITGASNFIDSKVELVRWTDSPQVLTETGDLLLTCKGSIGKMAFNDFGTAHIARQIMAIRNTFGLNSQYLELCMEFYIHKIKGAAKGLIPGISREDILNLILPVPPVKYQRQVVLQVQKINYLLSLIEKNLS